MAVHPRRHHADHRVLRQVGRHLRGFRRAGPRCEGRIGRRCRTAGRPGAGRPCASTVASTSPPTPRPPRSRRPWCPTATSSSRPPTRAATRCRAAPSSRVSAPPPPSRWMSCTRASRSCPPLSGRTGRTRKARCRSSSRPARPNLDGNGEALGQSITQLSDAARTLNESRGDLFDTVKNLQMFVGALAANDQQVREFNSQLSDLSGFLAGERENLGAALNQLAIALGDVSKFVADNREILAEQRGRSGSGDADPRGQPRVAGQLADPASAGDQQPRPTPTTRSPATWPRAWRSRTAGPGRRRVQADRPRQAGARRSDGSSTRSSDAAADRQLRQHHVADHRDRRRRRRSMLPFGIISARQHSADGHARHGAGCRVAAISKAQRVVRANEAVGNPRRRCMRRRHCSDVLLVGGNLRSSAARRRRMSVDHPMHLTIQFDDVLDLVPQSTVKVDGVPVGRVESIKVAPTTAGRRTWRSSSTPSVDLAANAVAAIEQTSLLGEKFVQLSEPPEDKPIPRGSRTATRSRSIAPGTPPRSSRYSARCRCCSTVAASASCSRSCTN